MHLLILILLFFTPFHPDKQKIAVSVCFIEAENKVLFLKRHPAKPEGGLWGIPGGKLDPGETPLDAAVREIHEETQITLDEKRMTYLGQLHLVNARDVTLHLFATQLDEIPRETIVNPMEHQGYAWMSISKARELPLMKGEEACFDMLHASHSC